MIIKCNNNKCISNHEDIVSKFIKKIDDNKIKYKLIKKSGTSPVAGSTGNDPHTIYIHQTSETEAKSLITDSKGKAIALGGGSSSVSSLPLNVTLKLITI